MSGRENSSPETQARESSGPPFPRAWFDRDTARVAQALLGNLLVVRTPSPPRVVRLVETEAYVRRDPASHAFRGPTPRNRSMFARAGTLYVFRIHQVCCANIVTRPGEAVLLRSAEPWSSPDLDSRGPGRLCRALGIGLKDDGLDVTSSRVAVVAGPPRAERVLRAPRVGIRRAAHRLLRFTLEGNRWVSLPRPEGPVGNGPD